MAHEILSIKLYELEEQIARLLSRIELWESADNAQLKKAIKALELECEENEQSLKKKLELSRSGIVSTIAHTYGQIEAVIHQCKADLQTKAEQRTEPDLEAEEKILLAEYALDFSVQAANRALLLAMEAMDAQAIQPKGESKSL